MSMMTHRNKKRKLEKESQDIQNSEVIEKNIEKPENEQQYTKTEINRMPLSELQEVAFRYGIGNATDMTGGELKRTLIEKLGL